MSRTVDAARILASRATQCSFSSVFHLRTAGASVNEMKSIKTVFKRGIIMPAALFLGTLVGVQMTKITDKVEANK